jgi:hypothetical protein
MHDETLMPTAMRIHRLKLNDSMTSTKSAMHDINSLCDVVDLKSRFILLIADFDPLAVLSLYSIEVRMTIRTQNATKRDDQQPFGVYATRS